MELPAPVVKAITESRPGAQIGAVEAENEAGIILYDIELASEAGEMEVAEDGTVMEISTTVEMKDVPKAAADAILAAAASANINELERCEVRAEVREVAGKGTVTKLATPREVYEAEMVKGDQRAEVEVDRSGVVIEAPKWHAQAAQLTPVPTTVLAMPRGYQLHRP